MADLEQGLMTIERRAVEPVTAVGFMRDGYAIEKNPAPVAVMFIPGSLVGTDLLAVRQPETDTAVTGEDKNAVAALIAEGKVTRPIADSTEAKAAPEKNGIGKNMLRAMRRSRLAFYVATAATTAAALFSANTETAKGAADPEYDPETMQQECTDIALAKPKILKSQLRNVGSFEEIPLESYSLSTQSQLWPEQCEDLYGHGIQARGQAFHKGRWINMNYWRNVDIFPDTGKGYWPGDIPNLENLRFPVCKARILLKANIVDLSVSMNEDEPWKPQHPTIERKQFPPIPAKILPRKPEEC